MAKPADTQTTIDKPIIDAFAEIEKIKNGGNDFFKKKEYHDAVARYDIAIEEYEVFCDLNNEDKFSPKSLQNLEKMIGAIYNNRAFCYYRLEMFGASASDASKAIKLKFYKAYYRRGCSYMALSKLSKAKKDFAKAKEKFPKNKDIKNKLKLATKAFNEQAFFAAIASDQGRPISHSLKLSDFPDPIASYNGPTLANDDTKCIDKDWIIQMHEYHKTGKWLPIRHAVAILLKALEINKSYKNVEFFNLKEESDAKTNDNDSDIKSDTSPTVTVCGDIHGQYYDYLHIFELNGLPSENNAYLFNGDFVDRGSWSCEVILSMLALKVLYPNHFLMTRGNHETINMNNMYGFKGEVEHKYSKQVFELFTELFNSFPLAYVLGKKVFVCHGGMCKQEGVLIKDIQKLDRFSQPEVGIFTDLLWSDPQAKEGYAPSKRGGGTMFGPDITAKFLKENDLELLIRSHEVQEQGYKVDHDGKLITIFSAPNYCDQMGNLAAFIKLDKTFKPKFTQFKAQEHPDMKPMAYGAGAFSMANFM